MKMEEIIIRQFKPNDLKDVRDIFKDGFKQYKDGPTFRISDEYIRRKLKEDMHDVQTHYVDVKYGNFWVAENILSKPPTIIGCVGVLPKYSDKIDNDDKLGKPRIFELVRMFVDKEYQGRGVAQLLIQELERFVFVKHGAEMIFLSTGMDADRALKFYRKQGYSRTRVETVDVSGYLTGEPDGLKLQIFEKHIHEYIEK